MVYLSANGEVIGQFEESELPSFLAAGRIGQDAFFWREGMPDWRPLRELVLPPLRRPASAPTPAASAPTPSVAEPARPPEGSGAGDPGQSEPVGQVSAQPTHPGKASPVVRKVFLPRAQAAGISREPRSPAAAAKSSPFIIPARPAVQPAVAPDSAPVAAPSPDDDGPSTSAQAGGTPGKVGPFVIPARPARQPVAAVEPSPAEEPEPEKTALPAPTLPASQPPKRGPFVIPARSLAQIPVPAESSPAAAPGPDDAEVSAPSPTADQPAKQGPFVIPVRASAPAVVVEPASPAAPVAVSAKTPLPVGRNLGVPRAGGIITAPPKPAAAAPSAAAEASPRASVAKTVLPPVRSGPPVAGGAELSAPTATAGGFAGAPARPPFSGAAAPKKRGAIRALLTLLGLLLLVGAGAAAWWFWPASPPALTGEVRLEGPDGSPAPVAGADVLLVSREELVARWRDQLGEARNRAAEIDQLLQPARAKHREKVLALELAARISELGDEYNMPDAEQLRADRDAAQAEESAAAAEVEKLEREKQSSADASSLLRETPEALGRTQSDASGAFSLPLPASTEGLAVLVVAVASGGEAAAARGWLVPLDGAEEARGPVRLSTGNALDGGQIEEIAGTEPPVAAEN